MAPRRISLREESPFRRALVRYAILNLTLVLTLFISLIIENVFNLLIGAPATPTLVLVGGVAGAAVMLAVLGYITFRRARIPYIIKKIDESISFINKKRYPAPLPIRTRDEIILGVFEGRVHDMYESIKKAHVTRGTTIGRDYSRILVAVALTSLTSGLILVLLLRSGLLGLRETIVDAGFALVIIVSILVIRIIWDGSHGLSVNRIWKEKRKWIPSLQSDFILSMVVALLTYVPSAIGIQSAPEVVRQFYPYLIVFSWVMVLFLFIIFLVGISLDIDRGHVVARRIVWGLFGGVIVLGCLIFWAWGVIALTTLLGLY